MNLRVGKQIYGLIGYPVKHSLSPLMHNAAFKALGIPAEYKLFEIPPEKLEKFLLEEVFEKDILGFNITIPHKVRAREILEKNFPFQEKTPQMLENAYYVKLSGAVNTVRKIGNKLEYFNTDATGFLRSLEDKKFLGFNPNNKTILLLGCGGAGRAIIASLSYRNVKIKKIYVNDINNETIVSAKKHFSNLAQLKNKLEFISSDEIPSVIKDCDLLVNASPVGMKNKDEILINKSLLHKDLSVYDIVYNQKTQLIKDAQELGLPVANGLSMLLYQGIDTFELWTKKKAPVEIMWGALVERERTEEL
jgi:shikimate dehydrogenase